MWLKGVGGGSVLVALVGGGRPILLFLLSPASEKRGIRYRWHPCTFSMIRVEDPGSSFMLYLGPRPPSLLCLTRANAKSPYAGDTEALDPWKNIFSRPYMAAAGDCSLLIAETADVYDRRSGVIVKKGLTQTEHTRNEF